MNQLKSITYVNAASIPFARVELDGNTLMVGANGAGKTTVLRSALYFYGVHEDSALGINIRKKKGFREYYFRELNSFIAFRYSNVQGNILVIAYRSANTGVKFKFVEEAQPIDDAELFLNNRIARSPDELWKRLRAMEYKVSEVISTLSEYRNILYGHAGAAYKKYAFFDTKEDYGNFIHVLSNVFVNSKLDASSIQKTISNAIPGFEPIDLEQIERSIESFRGKYDDVTKFESNRSTVEEILRALMQFESLEQQKSERLSQLVSNQKAFQEASHRLESEAGEKRRSLETLSDEFEEARKESKEKLQLLNDKIVVLKSDIAKAEEKLGGYAEQQIEKKLTLFASKKELEHERETLQKQYDELTGTQNSIREKFERLRESEQRSLEQQLQTIEREVLGARSAYQEAAECAAQEESSKIEELEQEAASREAELRASLDAAAKEKEHAYEVKVKGENSGFYQEELKQAKAQSSESAKACEEAENGIRGLRLAIGNINETIASIEKERELALKNLSIPHENSVGRLQEEIARLNSLLDISKESFLGFVREMEHPKEELITALVKDEVLLSTALEPSFRGASDSFFGFTIDTANLEASDYSRESIEAKIERVSSEVSTLEKQFGSDKAELENDFRNRLNEQRRMHRQKSEELVSLEIALPKLNNSRARNDDALRELERRAESAKEEALAKSRVAYERTVALFRERQQELSAFTETVREQTRVLRQEAREKREASRRTLDATLEELASSKVSKQSHYDERCRRIDQDEMDALANDGVNPTLIQEFMQKISETENRLREIEEITELVHAYRHDAKEYFEGLDAKREALDRAQKSHQHGEKAFGDLKRNYLEQKESLESTINVSEKEHREIQNDLARMERHVQENAHFHEMLQGSEVMEVEATQEKLQDILSRIATLEQQATSFIDTIRGQQDHLYLDIAPTNSLKLAVRTGSDRANVLFAAKDLKNFMDAGKIEQFKEEVSNLFGLTVNQLTKQTENLLEARQDVEKVVRSIKDMLRDLDGISVIDSIDLRMQESNNTVLSKLEQLQRLNDDHALSMEKNLFNFDKPKRPGYSEALQIIRELRKELAKTNKKELLLDDTYELEIRASENGNDTGWQVSLDEVGSNGTDVMIKAIVNIAMLAISLGLKRKSKEENRTYFHCILDEIGVLHPSYLRELMAYANNKRIRFLNGAPNRQLVSSFKRIYILTNSQQHTMLKPLLSKQ